MGLQEPKKASRAFVAATCGEQAGESDSRGLHTHGTPRHDTVRVDRAELVGRSGRAWRRRTPKVRSLYNTVERQPSYEYRYGVTHRAAYYLFVY